MTTKYGTVKTDHILFIAAGAFHVAKPSDLIPELQGRFPSASAGALDAAGLCPHPERAPERFGPTVRGAAEDRGVTLRFGDDAVNAIAEIASR